MATMAAYARRKDELFARLTGRVLEIGAGRGANFARLPHNVQWIGLEPARSHRRLRRRARAHGRPPWTIRGSAEHVPLAGSTVDAVVGTVVLCSVADQAAVLAEVRRVLRPGGLFLFFEHVAAPAGSRSWRLQRLAAPVTRAVDRGCDPTRETWRAIEAAGFSELDLDWYGSTAGLQLYAPFIAGVARG